MRKCLRRTNVLFPADKRKVIDESTDSNVPKSVSDVECVKWKDFLFEFLLFRRILIHLIIITSNLAAYGQEQCLHDRFKQALILIYLIY